MVGHHHLGEEPEQDKPHPFGNVFVAEFLRLIPGPVLDPEAEGHPGVDHGLLAQGVEARIKWPNDLYVGDRKICGILIENVLEGKQVRESIIGIGLNLNQLQFPADLPNPVSLRQLTGRRYEPEATLEALWEELKKSAALLETQEGLIALGRYFAAWVFRRDDR